MRTDLLRAFAMPIITVLTMGSALAADNNNAYAIGLWGDLPYNDVQALTSVPQLDCGYEQPKFGLYSSRW
jgi:hypothetical protein